MAGNTSNKRKPSNARVLYPNMSARLNVASGAAKLHLSILEPLNRIIDQTGNFHDWMLVVHRIYVGAVTSNEYFKQSPELCKIFNLGHIAMEMVMLRTHVTGVFGILVNELDLVTLALDTTDRMMRMLKPMEILQAYKLTEGLIDEIVLNNMRSYPDDALTPEQRKKLIGRLHADTKVEAANQPAKALAIA